jgi:hypothetical protein
VDNRTGCKRDPLRGKYKARDINSVVVLADLALEKKFQAISMKN